jgi:predicted Zn-dependent protease
MKPDIPINEAILIETRNIESSETKEFKKLYKDAVNYIKSNIYDKALKILLEMNIKYPNNPKVLNNLGIVYYKLNNLKDAYDILKNAIEVDDKNETLKKNLNKVIEKLNRN